MCYNRLRYLLQTALKIVWYQRLSVTRLTADWSKHPRQSQSRFDRKVYEVYYMLLTTFWLSYVDQTVCDTHHGASVGLLQVEVHYSYISSFTFVRYLSWAIYETWWLSTCAKFHSSQSREPWTLSCGFNWKMKCWLVHLSLKGRKY